MRKQGADPFYVNAGKRIQKLRSDKNLTREEVAKNAKISAKFLYEIESGYKGFNAITLYRVAKALDISCDYILGHCSIGKICQDECLDDIIAMFDKNDLPKVRKVLSDLYDFR